MNPATPPQAPQPIEAPPQAPGIADLIEGALRAAFLPDRAFGAYAALPQPTLLVLSACAAFWIALGGLINAVMVQMQFPLTSGGGMLPLMLGLGAAVLLVFALSFPLAGLVNILALASGGSGSLRRSYQLVAMLGILIPISLGLFWSDPLSMGAGDSHGSFLWPGDILFTGPRGPVRLVVGLGLALAPARSWLRSPSHASSGTSRPWGTYTPPAGRGRGHRAQPR